MLVSSFNHSQSFNYTPFLFYKKTVQIRDQFFLNMDPVMHISIYIQPQMLLSSDQQIVTIPELLPRKGG
jgi:hypothetical protein